VIDTGKLRTSVEIQKVLTDEDANGEVDITFVKHKVVKAYVRGLTSTEKITAERNNSEVTHAVTMRFTPDIETDHRLKIVIGTKTRYLNIKSIINDDERSKMLLLMCQENTTSVTSGTV